MTERELRVAIVGAARAMNPLGVNQSTTGNVSARSGGGMLITPSGTPYEQLGPDGIVALGLDGVARDAGAWSPSTEWRLHAAVYERRHDLAAIVHAHPRFATALACLRRGIPGFHYMVAIAGGADIRCGSYATPGSAALALVAVDALEDRRACLLANHGLIACGETPADALRLATEVEHLAAQYVAALQVGEPILLSADEMREIVRLFRTYRSCDAPTGPSDSTAR